MRIKTRDAYEGMIEVLEQQVESMKRQIEVFAEAEGWKSRALEALKGEKHWREQAIRAEADLALEGERALQAEEKLKAMQAELKKANEAMMAVRSAVNATESKTASAARQCPARGKSEAQAERQEFVPSLPWSCHPNGSKSTWIDKGLGLPEGMTEALLSRLHGQEGPLGKIHKRAFGKEGTFHILYPEQVDIFKRLLDEVQMEFAGRRMAS